jgi:hypothetical protein
MGSLVLEGVRYPLWRRDTLVRTAYAPPGTRKMMTGTLEVVSLSRQETLEELRQGRWVLPRAGNNTQIDKECGSFQAIKLLANLATGSSWQLGSARMFTFEKHIPCFRAQEHRGLQQELEATRVGFGLCETLAKPWHSNLQRRAAPDPPKFFNYDFFIVKLILA